MSGGPIGVRLRAKRFGEISPEPWRRRTLVRLAPSFNAYAYSATTVRRS